MSDALELREFVYISLASLLGIYKFTDGTQTPAIAVISGNGELYPPEGTQVTGLEVVIFTPTLAPAALLQGYKVKEQWVIHLKQWTVGMSVQLALDSLLSAELEGFVISQIVEIPADYRMGIPAGAQVKLDKFYFSGE
ncbi:hypothetical protein [Anabaena lutea]|uniref:DUF3168 domain-containing protein n=1 Tax=Anabaena lutea FACHB-196 TaxID=2692881 RepID=A0ABR8FMH9_9NOST|nr:hypothetical protein [Anabaena lutea]MBD2570055.1 hypothetical protein [Anabaena lutea FACHB-196]